MGYFSNGTEWECYEAQFCNRCIHGGGACPIMFAHFQYNYDLCNEPNSWLDLFIPRSADHLRNGACQMFIDKDKQLIPREQIHPDQLFWALEKGLMKQ